MDRRRTWGEERVYFHDQTGSLRRLPASWTSADAIDPFVARSGGRAHFRVEDLLRLVRLVSRTGELDMSRK